MLENGVEDRMKNSTESQPENDIPATPNISWRRLLARLFDLYVYQFIVTAFLRLVLNVNTSIEIGWKLVEIPLPIILMYFVEPVLLCIMGTTFGKWIFGIRVQNKEGRKLSYDAAKRRAFRVFFYGMGAYFTPTMLWRLWVSYVDSKERKLLPWEDESVYCVRDRKKRRFAVFVVCLVVLALLDTWTLLQVTVPKHRGSLTTAEFCDNYNHLSQYLNLTPEMKLDSTGTWIDNDGIVTMSADGKVLTYPQFYFVEENGVLVEVGFTYDSSKDTFVWADSVKEQMIGAVLAYTGAQKEISLLSDDRNEMVSYINEHIYDNFELTKAGIKMTYINEYEGYVENNGMMFPLEEETYHSFEFKMEMSRKNT